MKKSIVYIAAAALTLSACTKQALDKEDISGLDGDIWNNESTATLYLNRCYGVMMPAWFSDAGTNVLPYALHNTNDESNTVGQSKILFGTLGDNEVTDFGASPTSNTATYFNIRRVNILLKEIEKGTLSREVKTKIKSQAYFLRAWNYWNLVKTYGGVPYLTEPQDWIEDDLFVNRNKTSECIDLIIKDLDSAAKAPKELVATQTAGNRGRITRGAAMALKGRVLLHWASAQFNPGNVAARWERAYQANRAAYDSLTADGYTLFGNFANVLIDESNNNKEVIMIRSYDGATAANSYERASKPTSESGGNAYNPTWDLVKAFPMKNGLAIDDPASGYDPVYFWKNRDPRFAATIVYNGTVYPLGGNAIRRQWTYTGTPNPETTPSTTGFYNKKGINLSTPASTSNNGAVDWVEIRLAEVIMNLAECANATGRSAEAYEMITKIRARAGITAGANNLYGLKEAMTRS